MHTDLRKNLKKILMELSKLGNFSKAIIKHGTQIFLGILALGTLLIVLNHTVLNYNMYYEFLATSIIKTSFILFAEAVIGGLVIDFIIKRMT